jgi:hypothetical protein
LDLDRGLSDTDIRHRFTFASVYDLPIGHKRRFLGDMPKALDYIVGGWQLNNIVTIQSGPVYDVTFNGGRVDLIGDPTPTEAQRAQGIQLNPAAFRAPITPVFSNDPNGPKIGTLGRNVFRGRAQEYWDSGLFKNLPVGFINEQAAVQIRITAFNVLNHVNRGRPNANLGDLGSFGKDLNEQRRRQLEFGVRLVF